MEMIGGVIVFAAGAQAFFILLAAILWFMRSRPAIQSWLRLPLAGGAMAAGISLLFPVSELAFNIGPSYMPTCLTYAECANAAVKSAIWILAASALLAAQIFLYRRSSQRA